MNVRHAIRSLVVPDWNITDLQVQFPGPKQKVKIAKWIEIAERGPIRSNLQIVPSKQCLRSAQRILD